MKRTHIFSALGIILIAFGIIILSPVIVAFLYEEYSTIIPFFIASSCSVILGLLFRKAGGFLRNFDALNRNEGLLIVVLAWVVTAAIGAIPYLFYGLAPVDAYFESVSGITTTGATILKDFSLYSKEFFFWRSLTQWLGGMGIIVLFVAVLPQFKVAGRQMFFAEAPGPTEDKVTPRITHTAKALWLVYISLTIFEIICLYGAGLPFFDSVCNSLTTLSAGGFSPHPQSIMGYGNPSVTWIVTVFMLLAGANFALQYRMLAKRKPLALISSEEFRTYLAIVVAGAVFLAAVLMVSYSMKGADAVRESCFQILSIITTTGFSSSDFALWNVAAQVLLFSMMLIGGCAGSAGGGVKVIRVVLAFKYLRREIVKIVHPRVVMPIKVDRRTVPEDIQSQILGFLLFYLLLITLSSLTVTALEGDIIVGLVGTAATVGNIGPGFGSIGPMGTFADLSIPTKIIFIINMVAGRLELIPILAMLHPDFWRFKK